MEAVGCWPRGNEPCARLRSGFGNPTARILLFASEPRSVFVLPPAFDLGFGWRLASSSFRTNGSSANSSRSCVVGAIRSAELPGN